MSTEKENIAHLTRIGRIGDWLKKNQGDIAIVVGFVLVAAISFGVGYLAAPDRQKGQMIIEAPEASILQGTGGQAVSNGVGDVTASQPASAGQTETATGQSSVKSPSATTGKGVFVASKSGTKYYWPWSSYAKRIKPENLVWFNSESEAQKAGYAKSADFDNLAPAGYKAQ